jgi:hypothetical protein
MKDIKNFLKQIIQISLILVLTNVMWGKEFTKISLADLQANNMIESQAQQETKETQEMQQKSEESKTEVKQEKIVKKTIDECVQTLESQDVTLQLLVLNTCAKDYQKEEKMQDALLKLLNNSNNDAVQVSSLMLLSNQKKDKIAGELITLIQNGKFRTNVLKYASTVVLYSNIIDKTKANAKEVFQSLTNSEDELLKNLVENLLKKI